MPKIVRRSSHAERDRTARAFCRVISATVVIALAVAACSPPARSPPVGCSSGDFAICLVTEDISPEALLQANLDALEISEEPIISISDVDRYDGQTHEIWLTAEAYQRIQELFGAQVTMRGLPFAVCAGGGPVYVGAFWTWLSSMSFDGVVIMHPLSSDANVIRIQLGYPGPDFFRGPDPRSDPRVMQALAKAGKLKE